MRETQYQSLYRQFKMKSEEELRNIVDDKDYDATAKQVATDILSSDRKEYKQRQQQIIQEEQQAAQDRAWRESNPLYDDIHKMAENSDKIYNDIHFIKTIALVCVILIGVAAFTGFLMGLSGIIG